jgi:hypothetical protein
MGFFKKACDCFLCSANHSRTMGLLVILLLVSVLFMNVAILQSQQQLASMAASLKAHSVMAPASSVAFPTTPMTPTTIPALR